LRIGDHPDRLYPQLSRIDGPPLSGIRCPDIYVRLVRGQVLIKEMTKEKTVLKFDTGADGFMMMIYGLAGLSIVVLGIGIYFLIITFS